MTHALHRSGTAESLRQDYVLIVMTSRVNRQTVGPGMEKAVEIMLGAGPTNIGSSALGVNVPLGLDKKQFLEMASQADGVQCSYSSKEQLKEALARLKEAGLGISITVSGLIEQVIPLAQELGYEPHTMQLSLGIVGDTARLPDEEVLELTTMCGHSRVGAELARKAARAIADGIKTPRQASMSLGRPCTCGLFNLFRSDLILSQLAVGQGQGNGDEGLSAPPTGATAS